MRTWEWKPVLSALLLLSLCIGAPAGFAAENPGEKALKEFERVKKMNNDLAIAHFSNQIKKDAKSAVAYSKRGKAYSGNRDYDKALADYEKAMQLDAKLAEPYVGRAVVRLMKKDFSKCWEDVHKAESLGGTFWPSFMDTLKAESGRDK